jgi:hypothetical protein
MQSNAGPEETAQKRSLKKGPGLLISISIVSMLLFLGVVLWVNWAKPRIEPEPLNRDIGSLVNRIPGKSDALIYLGMKDIRSSSFWRKVMPDSMKKAPIIRMGGKIDSLMNSRGIVMSEDLDTLLLSFRRAGFKKNDFIAVASGNVSGKLPESFLKLNSQESAPTEGRNCYALDRNFWVCPLGPRRIAVASSREMLEGFLKPSGSFFQRDSLSAVLIDKAVYKSHLWFALPSPEWTNSALQSLTSANSDMKGVGNLNRILHLALSAKFNDGIEAETEWVYRTRRAAFFASTFLWGAARLSGLSESRTSHQTRELLDRVSIQQNLESVIIHTDLPESIFRKTGNEH